MGLRTPLYDWHLGAGAKVVEFGGWEMPLRYRAIVEEHLAVRSAAGIFDVSHMGKLVVSGPGARRSLEHLSINRVSAKPGRARYTQFLDSHGAILDDVIVTCLDPDRFLVVCNAGPRMRIATWIRDHLREATLVDITESILCLALQGPQAAALLRNLTPTDLTATPPFGAVWVDLGAASPHSAWVAVPPETRGWGAGALRPLKDPPTPPGQGLPSRGGERDGLVLATRTGYTGEDGFELFPPNDVGIDVWTALLDAGRSHGLVPVGLGARDTLRLEKGFLLSGQDFTGRETPLEASSERFVAWDHEFIGREALAEQRNRAGYRRLLGLRMVDRGIPRNGCAVVRDGVDVGRVTSGTFSPSLRVGIALAYIEPVAAVPGTRVDVTIRGTNYPAEVVKPPFL